MIVRLAASILITMIAHGCASGSFAGASKGNAPQNTPIPAPVPTIFQTVQNPLPAVQPTPTPQSIQPIGDVPAVDASCSQAGGANRNTLFPPKGPQLPATAPGNCRNGFELNNLAGAQFSLNATAPTGEFLLEVDLATYLQPDQIRIVAVKADGSRELLLDTCRLRTFFFFDPTDGASRPPEDTIRSFRIPLHAGVASLSFELQGTTSPYYLSVTGLCQFALNPPQGASGGQWRTH